MTINYKFQTFEEVAEEFLKFTEFFTQNINEDTRGVLAEQIIGINELLKTVKESGGKFELADFESGAIGLLEINLLKELKDSVLSVADYDGAAPMLKKLSYEIEAISVVLGLAVSIPVVYSIEDINKLSAAKGNQYDFVRLLRTIVESMNNEDSRDMAMALLPKFDWVFSNENMENSWGETFILMLLTNLVFNNLVKFSDELRAEILRKYFYRGIILGAPVRKAIENALYETENVVSYVLTDKFLFDAMLLNIEMVPTDLVGKSFNVVLSDYLNWAGNARYDDKKISEYVKEMYKKNPNKNFLEVWLTEALSIGVHLRAADLIKSNAGHELFADEKYTNKVIKLIGLFAAGEAGTKDLIDYFRQDKPVVSLASFIDKLNSVADLNKEATLNNCLEFAKNLQAGGLWPKDEDMVYFDEKAGKFYWSKVK